MCGNKEASVGHERSGLEFWLAGALSSQRHRRGSEAAGCAEAHVVVGVGGCGCILLHL
jgi:hypothetical protein